jgi:hypothetical protein
LYLNRRRFWGCAGLRPSLQSAPPSAMSIQWPWQHSTSTRQQQTGSPMRINSPSPSASSEHRSTTFYPFATLPLAPLQPAKLANARMLRIAACEPVVLGGHSAGHSRRRNALKHRHCRHVAPAFAR